MKHSTFCIPLLISLWLVGQVPAQEQDQAGKPQAPAGTLKIIDVPAPSLANSLIHMPAAQRTVVYLPPSYDKDARKRFPVVYFLPGFSDQILLYTHIPTYQGFRLQEAMDRLIGEKKIKEMIVVIANGLTPLGGSFYVNSPVNGHWEDFVCGDLVRHVDASFRTIAAPAGRALSGHSMGGFGAFHIGMRHPDVFAAVYALSPGLAAPGGLETHPSFAIPVFRQRVRTFLDSLKGQDACQSLALLLAQASYWSQVFDIYPMFALAYGAAFAPGNADGGPILEYPFRVSQEGFAKDPAIWEKCEWGFGRWEEKVKRNLANLRRLSCIAIDVGENDEYPWITAGCRYVAGLLKTLGIAHELRLFAGGHQDKLRERLEDHMLPTLSRALKSQ